MERTTSPLLSPGEREIIHDIESPRALIMRRLAMRDDAWPGITSGEAAETMRELAPRLWVPQPIGFGRALDREPIQEPPVRRHRRPWRLPLIVVAGAAAIVAAPWAIAGMLRWMGVGL